MFVSGFVIGFVRGWELALVMLCVVPPLAVAGTVMFKKLGSLATLTQKSTAAAGGVAEVHVDLKLKLEESGPPLWLE